MKIKKLLTVLFVFCFNTIYIMSENKELDINLMMKQLCTKLEKLEKNASDELIAHHCKSIKSIFQTECIVADIAQGQRLKTLQDTMEHLLNWLPKDNFPIEPILSGKNRLIYSFVSKRDQTLQPYALRLPQGWKKDTTYPLIVILHGMMGMNPSPVLFTSWEFKKKLGEGTPAKHPAYMLEVYGRGNTYYRGIGEVDVFEAMEDVKKRFKVDDNRTYLTGRSMGGGGGWNIATRTPDKWAAISLCCPAFYPKSAPYLPENMGSVPVRFWYGGRDKVKYMNASLKSHKYLQKLGFESEVHTTKDAGHKVPTEQNDESIVWLLKHTRTKVTQFKYIIDTNNHNGRNGIIVTGKGIKRQLAEIKCRIDDNKVYIDTINCTDLRIKPNEDGLNLEKETILIIWNGKKYYNGELKKKIDLHFADYNN